MIVCGDLHTSTCSTMQLVVQVFVMSPGHSFDGIVESSIADLRRNTTPNGAETVERSVS